MRLLALTALFATPLLSFASLTSASFSQLPGWNHAQQSVSLSALKKSCQRMGRSRRWAAVCRQAERLQHPTDAQARAFFQNNFRVYRAHDPERPKGLFTGYYAPTIPGTLKPTAYNRVPLYGKPHGLTRVRLRTGRHSYRIIKNGHWYIVPSRAAIAVGPGLKNTPILAWVHSNVERFFLQIQGSGTVTLPGGTRLLLGYDGENGAKYFPIGRYLLQSGDLKRNNVSMQSIRTWLNDHPKDAQRVMNMNPSFVFFRKLDFAQPVGAQGVPLTPRYSLAVDPRHTGYGTPVWLSTFYPQVDGNGITHGKIFQRLMIAQDTGGAIRGAVRGDVFWGSGKQARWLAGHMQSSGRLWVLLPA
jgi:membrane-bound lytic murein transglycosylase A